jgi:DNA-binding NarL/FixJ family response regulator
MKLVIYETTGDWAAMLRREVMPQVVVVETRSLDDLQRELSQSSAAVVGIEISAGRVSSSITAVAQTARRFPNTAIVALASRGLRRYEAVLREAGATHVVFSSRQVGEIAAIVKRRLAAEPENDFNAEETSLEEQVFARLPWVNGTAETRK